MYHWSLAIDLERSLISVYNLFDMANVWSNSERRVIRHNIELVFIDSLLNFKDDNVKISQSNIYFIYDQTITSFFDKYI